MQVIVVRNLQSGEPKCACLENQQLILKLFLLPKMSEWRRCFQMALHASVSVVVSPVLAMA